MTQLLKFFGLTIILVYLFVSTFGQRTGITNLPGHLTVADIDKICNSIDNNKNLGEGIREGEALDKKGGFDTYYLQDNLNKTLYRVTDNISTDKHCTTIFYYNRNKVIKAITTITDKDLTKKKYSATYYFANNKLIKKIGESGNYSNYKDILKQGVDFQEQFYKDMRRL